MGFFDMFKRKSEEDILSGISLALPIPRDNASSDTYNYRIEVIYGCVKIFARKMGEKVYDLKKMYNGNEWIIYDGGNSKGENRNQMCIVMPTALNNWLGYSIDSYFHEGRSIQDVVNWITTTAKLADVRKGCNEVWDTRINQ